jgi:hypothetical protein
MSFEVPTPTISLQGVKASAAMLNEIGERAVNMRPAFLRIRKLLIEGNRKQFETKGAYLGTPWAKSAPGTLARKARLEQDLTPMVASGDLERALSGGRGKRTRITRSSVSVGAALFYGKFGFGTDHSPPRPPIGISDETSRESTSIIEKHLLGVSI